jgi:hypothetical protein
MNEIKRKRIEKKNEKEICQSALRISQGAYGSVSGGGTVIVVVLQTHRLQEVLGRRGGARRRHSQVVMLHAAIRIHLRQSQQWRI